MSRTKAYIELHTAIFLFGFTAILGKLISLSEYGIVWYRLLFTCISILFIPHIIKKFRAIPPKARWQLAGIGVVVSLHWICFYGSIKYSNVTVTLSVLSTVALFTAFLEPLFFRKKIKIREILLGLMIIPGMFLIFSFGQIYMTGIVLGLLAALGASVFTVLNKKMVSKYPAMTMTFIELGSGLIFLTLLFPVYFSFFPGTPLIPFGYDWLYLVVLAVLCTTLAYYLALHAMKYISAFTANLSVNLEPVYGIIMAVIIFQEHKDLELGFYLGTAIILIAVLVHTVLERKQKRN